MPPALFADGKNYELLYAARGLDFHGFTDFMADEPRTDWGLVGNAVFKRVGLCAAYDLVFQLAAAERWHAYAHR